MVGTGSIGEHKWVESTRRRVVGLAVVAALVGAAAWFGLHPTAARTVWKKEFQSYRRIPSGAWVLSDEGVSVVVEERLLHLVGARAARAPGWARMSLPAGGVVDTTPSGEVAVAYYARTDELRVVRYAQDGRRLFDLALGQEADSDCGTSRWHPVLALEDGHTWVSVDAARGPGVIELDDAGQELGWLPCHHAGGCQPRAAYASAGALSLRVSDRGRAPRDWLEWYDSSRTLQRRVALAPAGDRATFDGRGGYYWIALTAPVDCPGLPDDGALRIVHADAHGCTFGPALPPEVALGEHEPKLAAGSKFVFVAVSEDPPTWERWLRGSASYASFFRIHRFLLDGRYLDSRWTRADAPLMDTPSFLGATDDEHLVLAVRDETDRWQVLGLKY